MFTLERQPDPINSILANLGNATVQSKINSDQEKRRNQSMEQLLGSLTEESSPLEWFQQVSRAKGLTPEDKENALKIPEQMRKNKETEVSIQKERSAATILAQKEQAGIADEQRKQEAKSNESRALAKYRKGEALSPEEEANLSPESQRALLTQENKPAKKEKVDKAILDIKNDEIQAKDALDSIARVRELEQKLRGPIGYGKALFNTSEAAEHDSLALPLIDPLIKTLNPRGALPTEKIKLMLLPLVPKASDAHWTQQGKLAALEVLTKQALARAQEKLRFLKDPNFNEDDFDEQTADLTKTILDYESGKLQTGKVLNEEQEDPFQHPENYKGRTATGDDGKKYKSDGKQWVEING